MEALNYIIGILGFVLSLVGTYFTYLSFVNPVKRLNALLKNANNWESFFGTDSCLSIFRHKKYPNFQLVINWNKPVVEDFHEKWINDSLYPDKTNNASYFVQLEINGMLLDKELFVSLDGHRWFVPVPMIEIKEGRMDENKIYYNKRQVQLANIIGRYHYKDNIYDFAKMQNISL